MPRATAPDGALADAAEALADGAASRARGAGEQRVQSAAGGARLAAARAATAAPSPLPFAPPWSVRPTVAYTAAATSVFIFPLVTRMWSYERERRRYARAAAGSEAVVAPTVRAAMLHTLCVLCACARNAAFFATRVVPDVLELADAVVAAAGAGADDDALVDGAALALALVLLDAAWDADRGLALVAAHAPLLLRWQSLAQAVFAREEARDAPTDLAAPQARACRAAAAVVVRLAEMQRVAQAAWLGA